MSAAIPLDHTQVNFYLAVMCCNGRDRLLFFMKLDQFTKLKGGKHITIHNKKRFSQVRYKRDGTCSSQRAILIAIRNIQSQARPVLEERPQELRKVTHR